MSMKLLLALAGAALIVLGTLAAVAVVSGPSPRLPVPWEGARTQVRAHGGGLGEVELDTTAPYVAYTLVLFNNTLIPGNFLALNGLSPVAVAYDSGKGELFVANQHSDTVSVISDATNTVVATIPAGPGPKGPPDGGGEENGIGEEGGTTEGGDNGGVVFDGRSA